MRTHERMFKRFPPKKILSTGGTLLPPGNALLPTGSLLGLRTRQIQRPYHNTHAKKKNLQIFLGTGLCFGEKESSHVCKHTSTFERVAGRFFCENSTYRTRDLRLIRPMLYQLS